MSSRGHVSPSVGGGLEGLRGSGWTILGPTAVGDGRIGDAYYSCVARHGMGPGRTLEIRRLGDTADEAGAAVLEEVKAWLAGERVAFAVNASGGTDEADLGGSYGVSATDRARGLTQLPTVTTFRDRSDLRSWAQDARWDRASVRVIAVEVDANGRPLGSQEEFRV